MQPRQIQQPSGTQNRCQLQRISGSPSIWTGSLAKPVILVLLVLGAAPQPASAQETGGGAEATPVPSWPCSQDAECPKAGWCDATRRECVLPARAQHYPFFIQTPGPSIPDDAAGTGVGNEIKGAAADRRSSKAGGFYGVKWAGMAGKRYNSGGLKWAGMAGKRGGYNRLWAGMAGKRSNGLKWAGMAGKRGDYNGLKWAGMAGKRSNGLQWAGMVGKRSTYNGLKWAGMAGKRAYNGLKWAGMAGKRAYDGLKWAGMAGKRTYDGLQWAGMAG